MSKRTYEELRDMLRHELDVLTKKGEITKENLDHFNKLTNTLWKVEELMQADSDSSNNDGQSMYYPRMMSRDGYANNPIRGNSNDGSYNRGSYDTGMSNRDSYADGNYASRGSYDGRAGRDADNDGRYSEDRGNYSRGRDSYRGYSRDGYSRHTAKERMIEKLEAMADKATSEKDRMAIMDCIEELDK